VPWIGTSILTIVSFEVCAITTPDPRPIGCVPTAVETRFPTARLQSASPCPVRAVPAIHQHGAQEIPPSAGRILRKLPPAHQSAQLRPYVGPRSRTANAPKGFSARGRKPKSWRISSPTGRTVAFQDESQRIPGIHRWVRASAKATSGFTPHVCFTEAQVHAANVPQENRIFDRRNLRGRIQHLVFEGPGPARASLKGINPRWSKFRSPRWGGTGMRPRCLLPITLSTGLCHDAAEI